MMNLEEDELENSDAETAVSSQCMSAGVRRSHFAVLSPLLPGLCLLSYWLFGIVIMLRNLVSTENVWMITMHNVRNTDYFSAKYQYCVTGFLH
jgi:hypothetical protein